MRLELRQAPRLAHTLVCTVCQRDLNSKTAASDRFTLVMEVMAGDIRWARLSIYELCPSCGQREYWPDRNYRVRAYRFLRRRGHRACRACKGLRRAFHVQGCNVDFQPGCQPCGGSGRVQVTCTPPAGGGQPVPPDPQLSED